MAPLLADLRFALRAIRRSPLFAAVAIASLALGIGANTAIFTLMDQLMLRQLPIRAPEQLVMLRQRGDHNGSNMGPRMHSYPLYQDLQKRAEPLSEVLCRRTFPASVSVANSTERLTAELVSGNFFTMLGVQPALGRLFSSAEDDQTFMGHPSAVLSHEYWVTRFNADPQVIGQKIVVNNYPLTIVGVSAPGFAGLDPASSPQLRVPVLMKDAMIPEWSWVRVADRRARWVQVFARLKPGYTIESASGPLLGLFKQIRQFEMTEPAAAEWTPYMRESFMKGTLHLEPAATGYSQLRNNFSQALTVLMAMVGLVLLIACANVANLLIARAFARQKEIAVRLSLGATRGQLIRQLLVESLVLSTAGGLAGLFLASTITKALIALIPAEGAPLLIQPDPDARILAFTLSLTFLTGILFGLIPAIRASKPDLWGTLKDTSGAIAGSGSLYLRKGLVASQVALSFLLLFGAGLFVRSLQNLQTTDTGFRELNNLYTFRLSPSLSGYTDQRATQLYTDLLAQLRAVPGVTSVGLASVALLSGDEWDNSMQVEGHTAANGEDMQAFMNSLSPGYFEAMGVRLLEGRDFRPSEQVAMEEGKAPRVAIVNRRFAEHFFKGKSAVGRRIGNRKDKLDTEIIGVVENSLYEGPREGIRRQVFVPHRSNNGVTFYVRTTATPTAAFSAIQSEVRKLDASMPIFERKTLESQLNETLLTERLIALLSAGFGLLATLLAAMGLYGVMAFVVARRTKEMGVRIALGATRGAVIWLVMREVLTLVALGLLIGIPAAFLVSKYVASQLYGVQAADLGIGLATTTVLLAVTGLAGLLPALRASRIDPILALRYE